MKFSAYMCALGLASFAIGQDVVDPQLGDPFRVTYYDAGEGGKFHATLVSYPFGSSSRQETVQDSVQEQNQDSTSAGLVENVKAVKRPKAAVLYVHGFNDYFFQNITAEKLDSAGYAFFAIDLHNYGRSLRQGEAIGELRDVNDYFSELDSAFAKIQAAVGDSVPKVLLGHSTGGLIALLYARARDNGKNLDAIVLNSPFLEMNFPWIMRDVIIPVFAPVGRKFPNIPVPRGSNDNYSVSLLKSLKGEWEFDTSLKVPGSIPIDLGWAAAIHDAQVIIQDGMELTSSILVMHSNCSVKGEEWTDDHTRCDCVLDVDDIRNYGAHLGPDVHLVQIQDGLHDLYLSRKDARDNAYNVTLKFLDNLFAK